MSAYDWLMAFGAVALVILIVKGFWSSYRVKPLNEPETPPTDRAIGANDPPP